MDRDRTILELFGVDRTFGATETKSDRDKRVSLTG